MSRGSARVADDIAKRLLAEFYGEGTAYIQNGGSPGGRHINVVSVSSDEITTAEPGLKEGIDEALRIAGGDVGAVVRHFVERTQPLRISTQIMRHLALERLSMYDLDVMDPLPDRDRAALDRHLVRLIERYGFETVAKELASRRPPDLPIPSTPGRKKTVLPELPPDLKWPTRTFSQAAKEGKSFIEFMEEEWSALIARGFGERRFINIVDPSAADGLSNFTARNPLTGSRKELPEHLRPNGFTGVRKYTRRQPPTADSPR